MINVFRLNLKNKVEITLENKIDNIHNYLLHKNYALYDIVSAKGINNKNLYKKADKYYIVGNIENTKIILYDVTKDIQNPENRV